VWEQLVVVYAELERPADTRVIRDEAARRLGTGHPTAGFCAGRDLETRGDTHGAQAKYTEVLACAPHLPAMVCVCTPPQPSRFTTLSTSRLYTHLLHGTRTLMSQHQLHHVDESTPTAPHCL
jgi:hypothetical protein